MEGSHARKLCFKLLVIRLDSMCFLVSIQVRDNVCICRISFTYASMNINLVYIQQQEKSEKQARFTGCAAHLHPKPQRTPPRSIRILDGEFRAFLLKGIIIHE